MRVCVSAAAWRCLSAGTVLNCLDFLIFPFVLQFFWDFFFLFYSFLSCSYVCVFFSSVLKCVGFLSAGYSIGDSILTFFSCVGFSENNTVSLVWLVCFGFKRGAVESFTYQSYIDIPCTVRAMLPYSNLNIKFFCLL